MMKIALISDIHGNLVALDAALAAIAGGHTHMPLLRRWQDKVILNPGSIGLPFHRDAAGGVHNPAWSEYALITVTDGRTDISLCHVSYDLDTFGRACQRHTSCGKVFGTLGGVFVNRRS